MTLLLILLFVAVVIVYFIVWDSGWADHRRLVSMIRGLLVKFSDDEVREITFSLMNWDGDKWNLYINPSPARLAMLDRLTWPNPHADKEMLAKMNRDQMLSIIDSFMKLGAGTLDLAYLIGELGKKNKEVGELTSEFSLMRIQGPVSRWRTGRVMKQFLHQ